MRTIVGCLFALLISQPAFAAKCYISEFSSLGFAHNQKAQIVNVPSLADQVTGDFSGSAQQSSAFNPGTSMIRVWCDTEGAILFGTNPTAANTNMPLAAFAPEYFGVPINQAYKLSVHSVP